MTETITFEASDLTNFYGEQAERKQYQQTRRAIVAPEAGAIALVRYRHAINSTRLVERLRDEQSLLLVPGDHFDMDGYLRIGFGSDPAHVAGGLDRLSEVLDRLPTPAADAR